MSHARSDEVVDAGGVSQRLFWLSMFLFDRKSIATTLRLVATRGSSRSSSRHCREMQRIRANRRVRESTTTSLSESIYNYRKEHGRTYHAYKDGKYIFPNDEVCDQYPAAIVFRMLTSDQREADRLDLQHHIFRLTYGNRLFFAPIKNPKRCIDIGTGTGTI